MEKTRNQETSQRILDTALALWSEKGYTQSTMRELARRLSMGVSSLYFYFRSKEEIVQFLYAWVNQQARERFVQEESGATDLADNFRRYLSVKLALLAPQRACLAPILKEAIDPESLLSPVSRESARVLRGSIGFFRELVVKAGVGAGKETALAQLLWALHIAVLVYWLHDRSAGYDNTTRLVDMLAEATSLLPLLEAFPGADELLTLLSDVLTPPPPPEASQAAVEVGASAPTRAVDVVVLGGGPIGALYASFLKMQRPSTSILILDRQSEPGHKIGESTLSGFCKALRSVGVPREAMQRLFYPKNGLGFLHLTEATRALTQAPEYVLEAFDETFQVERRVLDTLVLANAERLGIQVMHGAHVSFKDCQLSPHGNVVTYTVGSRTFRLRAALLVDASGPAGVVSRALNLRTDDDVAFQTGSVWTYYTGITPLASYHGWPGKAQCPRDQYTEHLCFREGWLWYIPLVSWQAAPTVNLRKMCDRLLQSASDTPSRHELEATYACPAQSIVSIGLSLRADRDSRLEEDPRGAFEHYARKYPAIRGLLGGACRLEDYYGPSTTFMSRLNYRGHARQVAGDGWLLVGDAAFFVDPLVSPGLTGGVAGAFQAALATVSALDAGVVSRRALADYEHFIGRLQPALERDNELVYMSFNHPEVLALIQRLQEITARRHFHDHQNHAYGIEDTNVWGILDTAYQEWQQQAWTICREEEAAVGQAVPVMEQTPQDYERLVNRLQDTLSPYISRYTDLTPYARQNPTRRAL